MTRWTKLAQLVIFVNFYYSSVHVGHSLARFVECYQLSHAIRDRIAIAFKTRSRLITHPSCVTNSHTRLFGNVISYSLCPIFIAKKRFGLGFSLSVFRSFSRRLRICFYALARIAMSQLTLLKKKIRLIEKKSANVAIRPLLQKTHMNNGRALNLSFLYYRIPE